MAPIDLLVAMFTTKTIVNECFERIGVPVAQLVQLANLAEEDTWKQPETPHGQRPRHGGPFRLLVGFAIVLGALVAILWYWLANLP